MFFHKKLNAVFGLLHWGWKSRLSIRFLLLFENIMINKTWSTTIHFLEEIVVHEIYVKKGRIIYHIDKCMLWNGILLFYSGVAWLQDFRRFNSDVTWRTVHVSVWSLRYEMLISTQIMENNFTIIHLLGPRNAGNVRISFISLFISLFESFVEHSMRWWLSQWFIWCFKNLNNFWLNFLNNFSWFIHNFWASNFNWNYSWPFSYNTVL